MKSKPIFRENVLQSEVNYLTKASEEHREINGKLRQEIDLIKAVNDQLRAVIAELVRANKACGTDMVKMENTIAQLKADIAELTTYQDKIMADRTEYAQRSETLKKELLQALERVGYMERLRDKDAGRIVALKMLIKHMTECM